MIKLSILMARKAGTSYEEFLRHWGTTHADVIFSQPATTDYIRRYVQNHRAVDDLASSAKSQFDGIAEVWFDSADAAAAFFASQDYQLRIVADEELFLDRDRCESLYSTDHVVIG
jgi:uncharacterized protein (TIGR02118 family)